MRRAPGDELLQHRRRIVEFTRRDRGVDGRIDADKGRVGQGMRQQAQASSMTPLAKVAGSAQTASAAARVPDRARRPAARCRASAISSAGSLARGFAIEVSASGLDISGCQRRPGENRRGPRRRPDCRRTASRSAASASASRPFSGEIGVERRGRARPRPFSSPLCGEHAAPLQSVPRISAGSTRRAARRSRRPPADRRARAAAPRRSGNTTSRRQAGPAWPRARRAAAATVRRPATILRIFL